MNATTTRARQERNGISVGDDVLVKLADFVGSWRIGIVTDLGFDLIRSENFIRLDHVHGRIYESDVLYLTKLG